MGVALNISDFGRDFLLLALRIGKYNKNYVDYYIGPQEISEKADKEDPVSPKRLLTDCKILQKKLLVQGYEKKRERYLDKMLTAMRTSIEILDGVEIPIKTQIARFYDVKLQPVKESELEYLNKEVIEAFGGSLSLEKQMADIRKFRKVNEDKAIMLFEKALNITRNRTKELFVNLLPQEELVNIELVKDELKSQLKWTYYLRYLGNFRSQVEINPNYNMYTTTLLSSAAHEGYPGHHTEFAIKEQGLIIKENQFEHSILLMNSPKLIISEGIADLAINALFTHRDQAEITKQYFHSNLAEGESLDQLIKQDKVKGKIHLFWYNLAYLVLIEGWNAGKLMRYALNFEIYNKTTIKNHLNLIQNNIFSTTVFIYKLGIDLVTSKFGEFPSRKDFQYLLENSILPSDLI
ncbi:MAG: hypothetical protein ACW986_02165 [Promethearchaeota archaeon]